MPLNGCIKKSLEEEKRLVVNMSWGLYYMGTLDGKFTRESSN